MRSPRVFVSRRFHMDRRARAGSYVFLSREKETDIVIRSACDVSTVQTHYGSCIFRTRTDTRTNKHHSLRTHVAKYLVPPVSFYLKAPQPELLPLLCLTSKLLLFGVCILNYTQKKHIGLPSRGTGRVPVHFFFFFK